MKPQIIIATIITIVAAAGCSSKRPILYDDAAYKKDPARAEAASEECIRKAEERGIKGNKLADAAESGAKGGVASAAAGAAGAAGANAFGYNYDVGASAGSSAAAGFAGNFALGLMDNSVDPAIENYVSLCLREKGYKVVTWK